MITHFISIREPYDDWILSGRKTIETRTMRMPEKYLNQPIGIYVPEKRKIVGTIEVVGQVTYPNVEKFRADYDKHLVAPGSAYDIKPGGKKVGLLLRFPKRIAPKSPRGRVYPSMINKNPAARWRKLGDKTYDIEGFTAMWGRCIDYPWVVLPPPDYFDQSHQHFATLAEAKKAIKNMRKRLIRKNPRDACYQKVKSRYKVWPSAYASGALVQCRKVGAENWGVSANRRKFLLEKKYGLRGWFMRGKGKGWIDCKTGLPCGRQAGEKRSYPACRPTKAMCSSAMRKKTGSRKISWVRKNPVPPAAVARVACRGLAKRKKYKRGGTAVGVARARDLCGRRNISSSTAARMRSYFARHRASRFENAKRKSDPTSPAAIADDLWGGSPGWAWAKRVG